MPALSPSVLVNSIFDAIQQSGGSCIYTSTSIRTHPRQFFVTQLDRSFSLWVYIWTVTHGGRKTLPNEYRIQMTSVSSPLPINPDGPTVLLGYYQDLGVFAGFDLKQHKNFTVGSPSVQISIDTINDALQQGLAFSVKENNEIAVGIRPDQLLNYVHSSEQVHQYGINKPTLKLLIKASQNKPVSTTEIHALSKNRRKIISTVSRYSRDGNFRQQVLSAYNCRCAVTRAQLQLVDAAHILPVEVKKSIDHVSNGISLSPTIHRAFDNRLIYLDERCYMRPNHEKIAAFLFCLLLLCSLNTWANDNPTKTSTERHIYTVIEFESAFMNRKKEKVIKILGEPDFRWEHRGKEVWTYHKIIKDQEKLWNQNIMFDFGRVNYMWGSDSVQGQ